MKLVAWKVEEIQAPCRRTVRYKLMDLLKEFYDSKQPCVKVDYIEGEYKSPETCVSALRGAMGRLPNMHDKLQVVKRDKNVYLINKELVDSTGTFKLR